MKTNIRISLLLVLLPAFFLLLLTGGCKKASDTTPPEQPGGDFLLKGSVVNAVTLKGIANARVYFAGTTILTTDANGRYQVSCNTTGSGSFDVRVMADGFGFGFATATIEKNAAMVNTIMLNPLAEPVLIGSAGGAVMVTDPEGIVTGSKTTLSIPAGAFSGNVNVTLTRFTGIEVPGYAPANMLNLCAVNLGPTGMVAGKAAELRFAMPFADQSVNSLPLMRYDFEGNNWVNTGTVAQVDHTTKVATVQVNEFGTYSLAVAGSFSESNGSGSPVTVALDPALSNVDFSYLAKNEYPDGTPQSVSLSYLKNIASQNTRINGARVSFNNVTTFTLNYIGAKPDSLAPAGSAGFYRWVPRVIVSAQAMPMTTTINGLTTNGIIRKDVYSPAIGYQFVHDQGGGGK
ncbi:MAG: hypothetical protein Q8M08_00515 [Bacteroidales bacterium]|nr:hypothetical protein [Bacteroidales bacterium]